MNVVAFRRFEALGRWLFAIDFATAAGLGICWAGYFGVDSSDRSLALLGLLVASIYLATSSFVAALLFHSCGSTLARTFYILAAVVGSAAMTVPAVAEIIR